MFQRGPATARHFSIVCECVRGPLSTLILFPFDDPEEIHADMSYR
jgi:hypothetical protein